MDMENAIMSLIQSLPNIAVALLALWWTTQRIDKLLEHQSRLLDELVEMMRENRRLTHNGHGRADHADG